MQFHVPQFIEVENKLFGPLTFKQFVYVLGGAGIIFILYINLPFFLTAVLGAPVAGFSLALAFLKIHGKPFIQVLQNAIKYSSNSKLYLWKSPNTYKKPQKIELKTGKQEEYMPKLTENKLQELSWSLDIKEKIK